MARDLLSFVGIVPLLPLIGATVLLLFGKRIGEPVAGWIATGLMGAAFVWSLVMFAAMLSLPEDSRSQVSVAFEWLQVDQLSVAFGFLADPLSITWILLVTGVGSLIFLYSIGYMHGDPNFGRFFAYLSLFAGSMLLLVLGSTFLLTFLGWEGVGLCSYLLISFWFERDSAAVAGKKAFVMNRVGDVGFLIAMFVIIAEFGNLDYSTMGANAMQANHTVVTAIALLLLVAAIGKSAQIPLFPWLTDAMEGPTPVSALIHAATMVTAGVYLIARTHPFFEASGDAMTVVAWVGGLTALLAGGAALLQPDIKRVLAYSTISQLGYMFLALGVGAYTAAVFMVLTHAFFKGCLFLGAGSVIHGDEENQDIRVMGRFRKFLPFTAIAMAVSWLSIAGIPPFAGFWSKDSILESAYINGDYGVWVIGLLAAIFTAMYMTRLIQLVFYGNERFRPGEDERPVPAVSGGSDDDVPDASGGTATATLDEPEPFEIDPADMPDALGYDPAFAPTVDYVEPPRKSRLGDHDPHESPVIMLIPIVTLAFLAVVGGLLNIPIEGLQFLDEWLSPVFAGVSQPHPHSFVEGLVLEGISVVFALVGITIGLLLYRRGLRKASEDPLKEKLGPVGDVLGHAYYYDEGLAAFTDGPAKKTARFLDETVDQKVIDGAVNGIAHLVRRGGLGLRKLQDGYVRRYAIGILLGVVAILLFLVAYVAR